MDTASQMSGIAGAPGMPDKTVEVPCAWAAAGVYLPSFESGHGVHELTQKIRHSKVSRCNDREFAELLASILTGRLRGFTPDLVISMPQKRTQEDRFPAIRRMLARRAGAADGEAVLTQTRVVEGYRQMTGPQRRACCAGRFAAEECVRGKGVLLIDDVITSGAQATAAIRALKAAGAGTVAFLAIAQATRAPQDAAGHRSGPEPTATSRRMST